jgi:2-C-methyl-D-erythritol 2,4-cyclodiphosphate synthase
LVLGGVTISDSVIGLHSWTDGDVVIHSLADALLSLTNQGDLGTMFPNSPEWKGRSSLDILIEVLNIVRKSYIIPNEVKLLLAADKPKLAHWIKPITENLSAFLNCPVSLSVTRTEGIIGKSLEGMVCFSFVDALEVRL